MELLEDFASNMPTGERNRITKTQRRVKERSLTTADARCVAQYVAPVAMLSKFELEYLHTEMQTMRSRACASKPSRVSADVEP
jgi:hypothetical protein